MLQQLIPLTVRTGETADKGNKNVFLLALQMTQYRGFKREAIKFALNAEAAKILNKVGQRGDYQIVDTPVLSLRYRSRNLSNQ